MFSNVGLMPKTSVLHCIQHNFSFVVESARIETPVELPSAPLVQMSTSDHMRVVDGPAAQKTQVTDLHVLIVEDNAINRRSSLSSFARQAVRKFMLPITVSMLLNFCRQLPSSNPLAWNRFLYPLSYLT